MVYVVIDWYISLFLKGLKIFLNQRLSLIVPLRGENTYSSHYFAVTHGEELLYLRTFCFVFVFFFACFFVFLV